MIDVRDADSAPGAKTITWGRHDSEQDNQLWYEDKYGNIRSKMNDFVIDNTGKQSLKGKMLSIDSGMN